MELTGHSDSAFSNQTSNSLLHSCYTCRRVLEISMMQPTIIPIFTSLA